MSIALLLPSGKETTSAGPHVEHPRSETHIEFFVGLELARLVRKLPLAAQSSGRCHYTPNWVYKQYKQNDRVKPG